MRIFYALIIGMMVCQSCSPSEKSPVTKEVSDSLKAVEENESLYRQVKDLSEISFSNICYADSIEVTGLYPTLDSIADDKYEKLVILDSLKRNGFKTKWLGRGNWMYGPRHISYTATSNTCECTVEKLYYSTEVEGKYKVTETLKCEKK